MPNLAKANLLARKTRSLVTIFGIGLSVALLLVMVGLVNGSIRDLVNKILNIGADVMVGENNFGVFYPSTTVNEKYALRIAEVDGVDKISPVLIESTTLINNEKSFQYVYGIDYDSYNKLDKGFTYVKGGPFKEKYDLILDEEIAEIFKVDLGDSINMLGHDWHICGVVKKALGASFYLDRRTLAEIMKPGITYGITTVFFVKVKKGVKVDDVVEGINAKMGEDWAVRNVQDLFDMFLSGALGLKEFMVALVSVSALICFAVILLSMYNSIIERVREIGILKSLGATKKFIITEILKEVAMVLTLGIITGYITAFVTMQLILFLFPLLDCEMTLTWMGYSAVIALFASLLGTVYPALRASNLDPVEALSWE